MARAGGGGGVLGIHVRKWLFSSPSRSHPAAGITQFMAQRGFAQERPEDSSTSNWGVGEPPIDEKNTERGVAPGSQESQHLQQQQSGSSSSNNHPNLSTDSEGQTNTPNFSEEKTTRDFINIQREARTHVAEGSEPVESEVAPEGKAPQDGFQKKGAAPADVAAG
ncbi:unnamed protein product [Sphagnum jensenii]|uniref:Uncharacterized protein n=1 Tax=Sphagnum jensenii TaxID=128206 RepID=A0ABP0X1H3_9BRYO